MPCKVAITSDKREEVEEVVEVLRERYPIRTEHDDRDGLAVTICEVSVGANDLERVLEAVRNVTGIDLRADESQDKARHRAARCAAYILRKKFQWKYKTIAKALGRQHHKPAIEWCRGIDVPVKGDNIEAIVKKTHIAVCVDE
jgi:hypothetical protein